jgi:hypothetical protein
LTEAKLDAIRTAIHEYDEHLVWRLTLHDGNSATLHIEAPDGSISTDK